MYFTTDEFRELMPDMDSQAAYPDSRVEFYRDSLESLVEQVCGTSFEVKTHTETVDGSGHSGILLSKPYVQAVTSVTVDGTLESGYGYTFAGGLLERNATGSYTPTRWGLGRQNVTVVYTAGWSTECPADLKLALMQAVRDKMLAMRQTSGKPSDRTTSQSNEMGGTTSFMVAGSDNPTGMPEVDATIMRWKRHVRVPGVA